MLLEACFCHRWLNALNFNTCPVKWCKSYLIRLNPRIRQYEILEWRKLTWSGNRLPVESDSPQSHSYSRTDNLLCKANSWLTDSVRSAMRLSPPKLIYSQIRKCRKKFQNFHTVWDSRDSVWKWSIYFPYSLAFFCFSLRVRFVAAVYDALSGSATSFGTPEKGVMQVCRLPTFYYKQKGYLPLLTYVFATNLI